PGRLRGRQKWMLDRLRRRARLIRRHIRAVYLVARDPRVPWSAKALALAVAAYALSPIDLIPDFIPVLGYLDDLILLPLGILLVIRLVPPPLMAGFRAATEQDEAGPARYAAAAVIIVI